MQGLRWALVLALGVYQPALAAKQPDLEKAITLARMTLDTYLADYPSARFQDVRAGHPPRNGDYVTFCGAINARNQAGSYSGWEGFVLVVSGGKGRLYLAGRDALLVDTLCNTKLVSIPGDHAAALAHP